MKENILKIENFKENCTKNGLRLTKQRVAVLTAVQKSTSHPDVETIYNEVKQKISNISVDTVYRTLQTLEDLGLIFRVDNQIPRARFDGDLKKHCHFICTKCGEVFDIFSEIEINIPKKCSEFGEIKHINLQIKGICNNCKKEEKEKNNGF